MSLPSLNCPFSSTSTSTPQSSAPLIPTPHRRPTYARIFKAIHHFHLHPHIHLQRRNFSISKWPLRFSLLLPLLPLPLLFLLLLLPLVLPPSSRPQPPLTAAFTRPTSATISSVATTTAIISAWSASSTLKDQWASKPTSLQGFAPASSATAFAIIFVKPLAILLDSHSKT